MEKLELKHLAPYLPYKLRLIYGDKNIVMNTGQGSSGHWCGIKAVIIRYKAPIHPIPILHHLSDLTKEIEVDGKKFTPINYLYSMNSSKLNWDDKYQVERVSKVLLKDAISNQLPYRFMIKLFEWHFDVFGLLEKDLAIDINSIKL